MTQTWQDLREQAAAQAPVPGWQRGALADKYVVPPFSILNTMAGDWQDRKRFWMAMGIQSELGRGEAAVGGAVNAATGVGLGGGMAEHMLQAKNGRGKGRSFSTDLMHSAEGSGYEYGRKAADGRSNVTQAPAMPEYAEAMGLENMAPGTSIFDPVLCELVYRWWCPDGGVILDPFAGGSVRGVVAGYMGHPYVGIDLSAAQVAANRTQAESILAAAGKPMPAWHQGDSLQVLPAFSDLTADLLFTCPPYWDLEVYSDDPADLSAQDDYQSFLRLYREVIRLGAERLAKDRFAVIVVGEVRDRRHPDGAYVGLVPDTIRAFEDAGLRFYNDVVLVNAAGSLPVRTGHQFQATRKIGKQHQNVLVFLKGRVARGWSVERTPPPSPQQSMDALLDPAPSEEIPQVATPDPVPIVVDAVAEEIPQVATTAAQQAVEAYAAAGACPCPFPDSAHQPPHEHQRSDTAYWCVTHDHPDDAPEVGRSTTTVPVENGPSPTIDPAVAPAPVDDGPTSAAAIDARLDPATNWRALDAARSVDTSTGEIVGTADTIDLTATADEMRQAGTDAQAMVRYHSRGKSADKHGAEKRTVPLVGARLAELLVGRHLDLPVSPIVTANKRLPKQVDVGSDIQVRYSSRPDASLITHPSDPANDRFVLVTGTPPALTLVGWCYGYEAKAEEFLRRPPEVPDAAYFMPAARLKPIGALLSVMRPGEAPVKPTRSRAPRAAPPTPVGMTVGAVTTDSTAWVCTGCGTPAVDALRTTVQPEIRRGACATCDRDKPFMVLE